MAAFGSSSSIVGDSKIGAKAFLLTMWIGYFLITGAAAIPREELDGMIPVLRRRGYNRFGNAFKRSDLIKDCIALHKLTLFAPTDESMEMAHISGLQSLAVSDLILLPSPTIITSLLPNHSLSITVRGTRRRVHIAVNGVTLQSPGLYFSRHVAVHGFAGALIPLSRFPSCCLPQSPIRSSLVETPSLSAYSGQHALLGLQSASSNGDLLPPPPPDTSIGFSISSTAAALTAATIAAGVIIHLFRPRQNLAPIDEDMVVLGQHFAPPEVYLDGVVLMIQMILNTLRQQRISSVQINNEARFFQVSGELGVRLRSIYANRLEILSQPEYVMHRPPDDVIMVVEMPDRSSFHLGVVPHFFMNGLVYDNSYVVRISRVDVAPAA